MTFLLSAPALIFLAIFTFNFPLGSEANDAPPDVKKVTDQWGKRVPAIHSLRFRWVKVTTTDMHEPPRRDKKPVPPPPTSMESKEILIIKGDRMRFETAGTRVQRTGECLRQSKLY